MTIALLCVAAYLAIGGWCAFRAFHDPEQWLVCLDRLNATLAHHPKKRDMFDFTSVIPDEMPNSVRDWVLYPRLYKSSCDAAIKWAEANGVRLPLVPPNLAAITFLWPWRLVSRFYRSSVARQVERVREYRAMQAERVKMERALNNLLGLDKEHAE